MCGEMLVESLLGGEHLVAHLTREALRPVAPEHWSVAVAILRQVHCRSAHGAGHRLSRHTSTLWHGKLGLVIQILLSHEAK